MSPFYKRPVDIAQCPSAFGRSGRAGQELQLDGVREAFGLHGAPIRLFGRRCKNPYAGKTGPVGPPRYKRPEE